MNYGLRIKDAEGNIVKITPLVGSIIVSGTYTSPTVLNGDNTYGGSVVLPATVPLDNLVVITKVHNWAFTAFMITTTYNAPPNQFYSIQTFANSGATYYQMNPTNYQMTTWSAGNLTPGDINTWDSTIMIEPLATWQTGWSTGYTDRVRIFSATKYWVVDKSASVGLNVYSLYGLPTTTLGVESFMLFVILKNWDY